MRKIGAMTPCWNEEATIAFTIASLLPYVDCYVVVDSGSTDKTLKIIKTLFEKELKYDKLILIEYGALEDFDISKPKNEAIDTLRAEGCSHFIRLDGDDVFYDAGAVNAVQIARELPDEVTLFTINHWELYQNSWYTTLEWLDAIHRDINKKLTTALKLPVDYQPGKFLCSRIPPMAHKYRFDGSYGHARIYRMEGARSVGKWTDEARGGAGEDIMHPGCKRLCIGNHDENIVHYGWARPMKKKLAKMSIWTGDDTDGELRQTVSDPRVTGLEKEWEMVNQPNLDRFNYGVNFWPRKILISFTNHPETFQRLIGNVKERII